MSSKCLCFVFASIPQERRAQSAALKILLPNFKRNTVREKFALDGGFERQKAQVAAPAHPFVAALSDI